MAKRIAFQDFDLIETADPDPALYNEVCRRCWPTQPVGVEGDKLEGTGEEDMASSSSTSEDGGA